MVHNYYTIINNHSWNQTTHLKFHIFNLVTECCVPIGHSNITTNRSTVFLVEINSRYLIIRFNYNKQRDSTTEIIYKEYLLSMFMMI